MTRNKYQHRPLPVRIVNRAGTLAGLPRRGSLNPDRLISAARRKTRLSDFGPDSWREGFVILCNALENEARLNPVGRLAANRHLLQLLVNRLGIEAQRQRDREIAGQRIVAPVFVTGLPRSGSTLLHGLLAQDPAVRVPWTWEVMLPCPPPGRERAHDRRRIDRTERMLRWVHRLAPRFRAVHPVGAELPQECIAITAHEFASVEFHTTFDVPSYQRWLDDRDGRDAMRYHRRFLQHLQARGAGGRWFLKAPAHLYNLPAIAETYPDARFVFTYRDPGEVAASIASHGVILRNAFSDDVDIGAVAGYWMNWWAEGWRRARQFRAGGHTLLELDYRRLTADPLAAVRELYSRLDMHLGGETEQRMRSFLSANPQDKHGRHRYTLSEFGLDPAAVESSFGG